MIRIACENLIFSLKGQDEKVDGYVFRGKRR